VVWDLLAENKGDLRGSRDASPDADGADGSNGDADSRRLVDLTADVEGSLTRCMSFCVLIGSDKYNYEFGDLNLFFVDGV